MNVGMLCGVFCLCVLVLADVASTLYYPVLRYSRWDTLFSLYTLLIQVAHSAIALCSSCTSFA